MTDALKTTALQFHAYGASITAIRRGSKATLNKWKELYSRRQDTDEVRDLPWNDAAGVGILNGPGGFRTFDLDPKKEDEHGKKLPPDRVVPVSDAVLLAMLHALGLPDDYRWVYRSGSGKGWEIAFLCHDELPANVLPSKKEEAGVFWGLPKEAGAFGHLELRWQNCQTIYPPSAYEKPWGPGYQWRGEAPDGPPAIVSIGHALAAFFAVAMVKKTEAKPKAEPRPKRQGTERAQSSSLGDAIAEIKRRFPLVEYARRHWPGDVQKEPNGEIRICGHGGLLINEDTGIWSCFQWETGGDAIELVGRKLYEDRWDNTDHAMFFAALEEAARETNVDLPPPPVRGHVPERRPDGRYVFRLDAIQPVENGDGVVTLKRTDYERLRARAEAAERLEEWRAWAMQVAQIKTETLSPAAKVVAFTLWPEMQSRKERGVEEPQRVYIEEASKRAGLSPGTYGAKLKELDAVGAIDRTPERQANGHKKILVQPDAYFQPEAWAPPAPRDHGGTRPGTGRPAPACPHPDCVPETPFAEEVSTISRLVCVQHGEFHVTPERITRRTWAIDAERGAWVASRFQPVTLQEEANTQFDCWPDEDDANPQLAQRKEDGRPSPHYASCTLAVEQNDPEANPQIDCWQEAPPPQPVRTIRPLQYALLGELRDARAADAGGVT